MVGVKIFVIFGCKVEEKSYVGFWDKTRSNQNVPAGK